MIHSDFERGFIKAEVVAYDDFKVRHRHTTHTHILFCSMTSRVRNVRKTACGLMPCDTRRWQAPACGDPHHELCTHIHPPRLLVCWWPRQELCGGQPSMAPIKAAGKYRQVRPVACTCSFQTAGAIVDLVHVVLM